jgi:hypothetical protein
MASRYFETLPEITENLAIVDMSKMSETSKAYVEQSLPRTPDPEDSGIWANFGLQAYLKSVEAAPKNDPKKLKTMKLDGTLPPLRPLSAYNYFFREERERTLKVGWISPVPSTFYSKARQEKALQEHWNLDRTKCRRHCKMHGQISFVH